MTSVSDHKFGAKFKECAEAFGKLKQSILRQSNYTLLMERILESRLYKSEVHGLKHWLQVEYNGILLADKTGADIDVVRLFALFHDSKRANDNYDCEHGIRGAEFAKECRRSRLLDIDDSRFEKLYHACAFHTDECGCNDITINTCYDADRLDLGRVGIKLDPMKMATEYGKHIATLSLNEQVPVVAMRDWLHKIGLQDQRTCAEVRWPASEKYFKERNVN